MDITVLVLKLANWGTVWKHARALTRDVFDKTHDLIGVAVFVVVTDVYHQVLGAASDRRQAIDDAGFDGTNEIRGDQFWVVDVIDLLAQIRQQRYLAQVVVDLVFSYLGFPARGLVQPWIRSGSGPARCSRLLRRNKTWDTSGGRVDRQD